MEQAELRLRLIEAAAKNPTPHKDGYAAGVLETARAWEIYVRDPTNGPRGREGTLGLPKK